MLGLVKQYKAGGPVKKIVSLLMALAFLPANMIEERFQFVVRYAKKERKYSKLKQLFAYFKWTWMEDYGPEQFSVYGHPHRTNNALESFHCLLLKCMRVANTNIWIFTGIYKFKTCNIN